MSVNGQRAIAALEKITALQAENERLRKTVRDALTHAKRAWFAGRLSDDGEPLGEYPIAEFNAEAQRLSDIAHEYPLASADATSREQRP